VGTAHFDFPPTLALPLPQVRAWLRAHLRGVPADTVSDAELVATELLTNAYEHATGAVALRLCLPADRPVLRLEVDDACPDRPPDRDHVRAPGEQGGRGLLLISALTTAWGVLSGAGRKTVWAELQLGVNTEFV
jgi:anti-sigma regulatory factor (Ser/Thr protein kinase)